MKNEDTVWTTFSCNFFVILFESSVSELPCIPLQICAAKCTLITLIILNFIIMSMEVSKSYTYNTHYNSNTLTRMTFEEIPLFHS